MLAFLTVSRNVLSPHLHNSNSLWLGIPFGFTLHGEVLIEGEGDERAGCLSCDGGQLLNWATNTSEFNPDRSFRKETLIRLMLSKMQGWGSSSQTSGFLIPLNKPMPNGDQQCEVYIYSLWFCFSHLRDPTVGNHWTVFDVSHATFYPKMFISFWYKTYRVG